MYLHSAGNIMSSCRCKAFKSKNKRKDTEKRKFSNNNSSKTPQKLTEEVKAIAISKEVEGRKFRFEDDNLELNPLRFWEKRDLDTSRIERNLFVNKADDEIYVNGAETVAMLRDQLVEQHKQLVNQIEDAKLLADDSVAYMKSFRDILLSTFKSRF